MLITSTQPFILVSQTGASRNADPQPGDSRPLQSLKGRAAARLIVELLSTGKADSVRSLAQQSRSSPATASRVTVKLADEGLIRISDSGLITVPDRLSLARRWAEDYSFAKTYKAQRYYSMLGDELALTNIKTLSQEYRLTGPYAAKEYYEQSNLVSPLPAPEIWIYASEPGAAIDELGLVPNSSGSVLIAKSSLPESTDTTGADVTDSGLVLAEPWRVVGDLLSSKGRLASLGASLGQLLTRESE